MPNLVHLKSLQALELAVRKGSLKAAADELAITPAAVGQRIKALEDYLGCDLLVRGRSGIRPTGGLEVAMAHLSAAFRELETAVGILGMQLVQEIHIVADSDWAELWLRPRLQDFKSIHPNTLFCVNGVGDVPLRMGSADCEIWFGKPNDPSHECELFRDYLLPVSSPANTVRISALPKPRRLEDFPLLHLDCYKPDPKAVGWPEWIKMHGYRSTAPGRGIRYQHIAHALEAVYADAGLIVCGLALVKEKLETGRLSLPFSLSEGAWTDLAYRARFAEELIQRPQVAQFREWLISEGRKSEAELRRLIGCGRARRPAATRRKSARSTSS